MRHYTVKNMLLVSLMAAIFCACVSSDKDNQIKKFLLNDAVDLRFYLQIDSNGKLLWIRGEAADTVEKRTYPYPGILFLDDRLIVLLSGPGIVPDIDRLEPLSEGKHVLKVVFPEQADNFNMATQELPKGR